MCAVDLGRVVNLYEQAASDDGEITRPKEPNWTAWANDVRTMRMLDGRSHETNLRNVQPGTTGSVLDKSIKSPENSVRNGMNWLFDCGVVRAALRESYF